MNRQTHMESYIASTGSYFMIYQILHHVHFNKWVLHKCLQSAHFRVAVEKGKRSLAIHSYLLLPIDAVEVPIDFEET